MTQSQKLAQYIRDHGIDAEANTNVDDSVLTFNEYIDLTGRLDDR